MKIANITIHNFRSISHASFNLEDYSLLIGENNAGKSNVFRALRVFYEQDLKYDNKSDFPKYQNLEDKESWIEIEYITTDEEQETLKNEYKAPDKKLKVRKILSTEDQQFKDKIDPKQSSIFAYENGILSTNYFYGAQNISLSKLGKLIYIPELSKVDDNLKLSGPSPLREIITFVMKKVVEKSKSFENLSLAFENFNESFRTESSNEELSITSIENDINHEIGSWGIEFGLKLNAIQSADIVKNLVSHHVTDSILNQYVAIDSFGQGLQRHLIYTLLKLSAKYTDSKKIKKKEFSPELTLILFEEPEIFLHPSQQEKMNMNLKKLSENEDQQILITTHSPIFVSKNISSLSSLIKVKKDHVTNIFQINDNVVNNLFEDNAYLSEFFHNKLNDETGMVAEATKAAIRRYGLTNPDEDNIVRLEKEKFKYALWMDSERTSLFFAKHVLICEGASEKIFLDYLINHKWADIKDKHLYILDAMGKFNINRFMNLFGFLGIPHSVLMDTDDNVVQTLVNEFIEENRNDLTNKIHLFERDLEAFLEIEAPPRNRKDLKPLNIMYKYSQNEITTEKIDQLRDIICDLTNIDVGRV